MRPRQTGNSPDLPGSIYDAGEELFGTAERDALLGSLTFGLQPGWAPQFPTIETGLAFLRFNRIEGFSYGASATSALGFGYTAQLHARIGTGDKVPNAELSLTRSNGRSELHAGVFHKLAVANDDWGAPLSFGASISNLITARDEGFYYRTSGIELGGRSLAGNVLWRAFAERQRSVGREPNSQASLGNLFGDALYERNIDAAPLTLLGVGGEFVRAFGGNPAAPLLLTRTRAEGAFTHSSLPVGSSGYGRLVADGTLSHGLGRFAAGITAAAGTSMGNLPSQRAFYIGGLQTVRGQFARPSGAGRVGDAFWLTRTEVGTRSLGLRPTIFYDIGWAGSRNDFLSGGRPLSGAGVGISLLDRLVRVDASRGIAPREGWRFDLYLGARF